MGAAPSSSRYLATGPLVWVAVVVCTTVLLSLLKQALWLVVPFLLAIILYYALFPAVRRLTLAGVRRETAAVIVAGAFCVAALVAMLPMLPWLAAQATGSEDALLRYFAAGRALIERTLTMLESEFGFLKQLGLHAEMNRMIAAFGETYVQTHLTAALLGAAAWLPSLLLAPFVAFFLLRDGRRFLELMFNAVPNAYFERTLYMVDRVDRTARAYFQGLLALTVIDTLCLAFGLWVIGIPGAFTLGLLAAVLAWIPYVGSIVACLIVVLVAATDFPANPLMVYWAVALFVLVRLLDDFVFMPLTLGRSLHMHPLPTVLLIFLGGAVAGIPGLILVLPLAGIVMVIAGTIGGIIEDPRLRARHRFAKSLESRRVTADLQR
ncbi:MAG TPA: AI-2E family transporter [Burkholderiaceae bacterium]|nr:AI-2E family transporter [Burkholderiaceae bacterium]